MCPECNAKTKVRSIALVTSGSWGSSCWLGFMFGEWCGELNGMGSGLERLEEVFQKLVHLSWSSGFWKSWAKSEGGPAIAQFSRVPLAPPPRTTAIQVKTTCIYKHHLCSQTWANSGRSQRTISLAIDESRGEARMLTQERRQCNFFSSVDESLPFERWSMSGPSSRDTEMEQAGITLRSSFPK